MKRQRCLEICGAREGFLEGVAFELGRQGREMRGLLVDGIGRGSRPTAAAMVGCGGESPARRVFGPERKAGLGHGEPQMPGWGVWPSP